MESSELIAMFKDPPSALRESLVSLVASTRVMKNIKLTINTCSDIQHNNISHLPNLFK